jgi:taurine--2-oxoglutarate transaminase
VCLEGGLYVYTHWHTVLIIPPLPITEAQLQEGFAVLDQALEETDKARKPSPSKGDDPKN